MMIKLNPYFNRVNSYKNMSEFPHTLMLLGESGSGRHTIYQHIVNKFNLKSIDLTEILNTSSTDQFNTFVFNNIITSKEPIIYLIDFDKINSRKELKQNNILKLIEEPQNNTYLVLFANNSHSVLGTIYNRCQVWKMPTYSKVDLYEFTDDINILEVATTPGQVVKLLSINVKSMSEYAQLVISKAAESNFNNVLSISNKLAFKQEEDKYDVDLFIKFLLHFAKVNVLNKYNKRNYYIFECTKALYNSYYSSNSDSRMLFDNYLTNLKLGDYYEYEYSNCKEFS